MTPTTGTAMGWMAGEPVMGTLPPSAMQAMAAPCSMLRAMPPTSLAECPAPAAKPLRSHYQSVRRVLG